MTTETKAWVLVPCEPTKEMIDAGRWSEYWEESSHLHEVDDESVRAVWVAMRDAAMKGASHVVEFKPLTDEQLDAATQKWSGLVEVPPARLAMCREFARAIERKCADAWGVKLEGQG